MVDDSRNTKIDFFEINKSKKLWQYGISLRKRAAKNLFSFNVYILKPFFNDSSKLICCGHLQSPPFVLCCSKNTPETQQKLRCNSNDTNRESTLFLTEECIKTQNYQINSNVDDISTMIPSLDVSHILNDTKSPNCLSQIALPPFIDEEDDVSLTPITPSTSEHHPSIYNENENLNLNNISEYDRMCDVKVKRMRDYDYMIDFYRRKRIELDFLDNELESLPESDY